MSTQTSAPLFINNARVVLYAILDSSIRPTGACTHIVAGSKQQSVPKLVICQYPNDESFYLFYCNQDWQPLTDTWHLTLEDAKHQAEFEYEGVENLWKAN